jgi:hypothetical protein
MISLLFEIAQITIDGDVLSESAVGSFAFILTVMAAGWTSLQLRVLHELVYSARRMGNAAVAIRLVRLSTI